MNFKEKDLEDFIFHNSLNLDGRIKLAKAGLPILDELKRQVYIKGGGRVDLMEINEYQGHFIITIYELKKDKIDYHAILQSLRYKYSLKQCFLQTLKKINYKRKHEPKGRQKRDVYVNICLIGKYVEYIGGTKALIKQLAECDDLNLSIYDYCIVNNGIIFNDFMENHIGEFNTEYIYNGCKPICKTSY